MQALPMAINAKIPGSPPARTRWEISLTSVSDMEARTSTGRPTIPSVLMRVWIDLTNSPHVLVMRPVIEHLRADGHDVAVTARDFAQTLELCERLGIAHTAIGHHRGGRVAAKAGGLVARSTALVRWARGRGFEIALGHSSNDVTVAAALLRIPSSTMFDYEWATVQHNVNCRLARAVVVPDAIPPERLHRYGARGKVRAYEGLKEEYYLADFEPDEGVLDHLGLDRGRAIVVVRTPPELSLYHRFENDLFAQVLERLRAGAVEDGVQAVVLPRVAAQREQLARMGGFVVPAHAIDAQSLIAYADLVISAGGTMNREAVALGTPVYSTFQGRLGAVDERLMAEGRLRALRSAAELDFLKRTPPPSAPPPVGGDDVEGAGAGASTAAPVAARVRRDPAVLVELLLSPLQRSREHDRSGP